MRYLREHRLHSGVYATSSLEEAAAFSKLWVSAVPTQAVRETLRLLRPLAGDDILLCNAAKGIEIETGLRISQIADEELPGLSYSVISGPSHAEEVIVEQPTAVVVASSKEEVASMWQEVFGCFYFRVYTSVDVTGVELGGAVKNVIAIASGIARSMGLGDNTLAALVCRGLAEIMRLGAKMGANPLTLAGLAGVGDLVVTCYSTHSRNLRLGMCVGEGMSLEEAQAELGQVAEGAYTVIPIVERGRAMGVDLPIAKAVRDILYGGITPKVAMEELLLREMKPELPPQMLWSQ
jgi:glycerol-3-phosphate dehydrogenase (NAD(P)+)